MTREEIIASCKAGRETADGNFVQLVDGNVIQFVPRPNPNRKSLEQQAAELLEQVDPVALRHQDTAPSEYVAPPEDCA